MFYFVVNPIIHMFGPRIGSFIREACGKEYEDTQNIYKYAVSFVASALVSTFIFASGSYFLGSFQPVTRTSPVVVLSWVVQNTSDLA